MKGCFLNIIKAIIIVFAVIGFMSIGGGDFFVQKWNEFTNPPKDIMLERAKKVGDFSQIPDEYEIDKAASALGYNGVLAEHKATGQKLVVVDSGKKPLLSPSDFKDNTVEEKLQGLTKKLKYQFITIQDLKITKKGKMKAFGKNSPYVRFEAKASKLPIGEISGIVSAVETKNGEEKVLIAVNEKGKYSQLITEEFFKNVKE